MQNEELGFTGIFILCINFPSGKPKALRLPQCLANTGLSVRIPGSQEEVREGMKWVVGLRESALSVSKNCSRVIPPIPAFSLQLGHRFFEGRHPAGDICMPNGTFVPSYRASGCMSVLARLSWKDAAMGGRESCPQLGGGARPGVWS